MRKWSRGALSAPTSIPMGLWLLLDRRTGAQKQIVLLRQVQETTLFPIPVIRSVLSSTMWNTGSAQRLLANKYHLAITSWCPPPSQGKSKAPSSQGSTTEIMALRSSPWRYRGLRKGWRCFLKHLLTAWLTCSAMSHPEHAFIILCCLWFIVAMCKKGVICYTAVQGHATALPCPQRVSYMWHMAAITDSDPVLVLVK